MKRKLFIVVFLSVVLTISISHEALSQCAMCRMQLENNVSNGDPGVAAGINVGILYLLAMPYLSIFVIGYFWYKNSRKNESTKGSLAR